jgi:hypothetical protein
MGRHKDATPAFKPEVLPYSYGDFLKKQHIAYPPKLIVIFCAPLSAIPSGTGSEDSEGRSGTTPLPTGRRQEGYRYPPAIHLV